MDWEPVEKALTAATFLILHALLAAVFILCMFGLEWLIKGLWGSAEPRFFGVIPVRWRFHAIDLGVLLVFGCRGIEAANKAFEE